MNILLIPHNWLKNNQTGAGIAGGEVYLLNLCRRLQQLGHVIRCIAATDQPYTEHDIEVYPQGEPQNMFVSNKELFQWCDIIVTQLIGTAMGYNTAFHYKKPLVFIAHNNSTGYPVKWAPEGMANIIYNSHSVKADLEKTIGHFNGIVVHPVIKKYKQGKKANKVTLINCSHNKGGHILSAIAERLPNVQFLGVLGGYQEQITIDLPNVTYLPNGADMAKVFAQTSILIAPSQYESYSQVCAEALTAGIPVIANDLPGIHENLLYAGIYVNRPYEDPENYIEKMVNKIIYLIENKAAYKEQSDLCLTRAASCEAMNNDEIIALDKWLKDIKQW